MPRATVPGFVGPSNELRSWQADTEQTINLFGEPTAPGQAKAPSWLQPTPGLEPAIIIPGAGVHGLFEINGSSWGVVDTNLYRFDGNADGTLSIHAGPFPIANVGEPVSFASSGTQSNQVMLVSGFRGYVYDKQANTVTQITSPGFPGLVASCEFVDDYFLAQPAGANLRIYFSALNDPLSWDPLDFFGLSASGDNIDLMRRVRREIWVFCRGTTSVWYNQGDPNIVFAPLQGITINQGGLGLQSAQRILDTIMWLGMNENGGVSVYRANGYQPERVSTYAVDQFLQRITVGAQPPAFNAITWVYQESGHTFYVITDPGQPLSWAYDTTTGQWANRGTWDANAAVWRPNRASCHMFAYGSHYVGDQRSGTIYRMSTDYFEERLVS